MSAGRTAIWKKAHMDKPFYVHATWDEEARVWVASSDDVPGLATELLELNGLSPEGSISFELLTRRFELAA